MKLGIITALAALVLVASLYPSPAAAAFTVCNSTTYGVVNVAYAVTWRDSNNQPYGESQGWWAIDPDTCKIILKNDISAYTVYIYAFANSDPTNRWWGGTNNYCLDPHLKFLYHGDAMDAPCNAGKSFGMRYIDTGSQSTYTYYLYN
ncbi:MAG: DUF1036 domain-containing protein [Candidatus Eremiobacteraeota bacterium]|nr:DUF1036 domain-containing protein [Candidatus Eremiobacteraeota bacterium]MBV8340386.1 DUF1036 domain-containing protein [Candidatus Eremiobacteraeota bacterium]MBV8460564.1 DUF1036 domain-containing protein [Candidatus Eremiobacteraeota bacterium]MBV8669429.1 DUF1036 domain-containing protein [Candidatus Eremiobacteraeota bacterium]